MKKIVLILLGILLSLPLTNIYSNEFDTHNPDFALKVAMGKVPNVTGVRKFGESPDGIQTTATDIWSRADSTPTQQIWLAPTAAAKHLIKSSDAGDAAAGVGARTVQIFGLVDWASKESSEIITLNGTTDVTTDSSYVIIHRMIVLTSGATSINEGIISATATAPSATTITAIIAAGDGQTEMAIYGVPSTQDFYLTAFNAGIDKTSAAGATADFIMRVNNNPNVQTTNFVRKDDISVQSTGANYFNLIYTYYPKFSGPCIIKVQAIGSANDIDGAAGFQGFLVNK